MATKHKQRPPAIRPEPRYQVAILILFLEAFFLILIFD
jgi:hypothetical protein